MRRKTHNKLLFVSLLIVINFSFVWSQTNLKTVDKLVDFGMRTVSNRNIDAVIVHSVYNVLDSNKYDINQIIKQFSKYHVSSHYVIGRDGTIYQLVKEKDVAFQAGKSSLPDGRTNVNSCSIGIELITSKDSLDAPTQTQIISLVALVKDIQSRYKINFVLRHSDIAPGRKTDPWNMNWEDFLKRLL